MYNQNSNFFISLITSSLPGIELVLNSLETSLLKAECSVLDVLIMLYVCTWACIPCPCICLCPQKTENGMRFSRTTVAGSFDKHNVRTRIGIQVAFKSKYHECF